MTVTFNDLFCGAGGSSTGLVAAGMQLALAANHWERAIETHAANHPDAEHVCADINHYDMRRLPKANVLWISPICTEGSPANGQEKAVAQMRLDEATGDHVPLPGWERTRATAYDAIRALEVGDYQACLVENVPNFILKWPMFDWWFEGMTRVGKGYNGQIVCASSAHLWDEDNEPAPQWRDRVYIVFTRKDLPLPDVQPRPWARCFDCDLDVQAVQWWKNPRKRKVGNYGRQYLYRCPVERCHAIVEPYVAPAAAAIDWTDLGRPVHERKRQLAPATLRRIKVGLEMFGQPTVLTAHGNTYEAPGSGYVRAWPAGESPLMTRTGTPGDGLATPFVLSTNHSDGRYYDPTARPLSTATGKIGEGLVIPDAASHGGAVPFVTTARRHSTPAAAEAAPLATVTAGGNHHGLAVPPGAFVQKHHGGLDYAAIGHMLSSAAGAPFGTLVGKVNMSLVVPYRRGATPHPADSRPLSAITTHESHALATITDEDVQNTLFRMLKPREHLNGQRFPGLYLVKGNQSEQTMQAGNAVSCNAAQWLGKRVLAVLERTAAVA